MLACQCPSAKTSPGVVHTIPQIHLFYLQSVSKWDLFKIWRIIGISYLLKELSTTVKKWCKKGNIDGGFMKYFKTIFSMAPTMLWPMQPTNIFTYKEHAKVINLQNMHVKQYVFGKGGRAGNSGHHMWEVPQWIPFIHWYIIHWYMDSCLTDTLI